MAPALTLGYAYIHLAPSLWRGQASEKDSLQRLTAAVGILGRGQGLAGAVSLENIQNMVNVLRDQRGLSPATINRYLSALRTFLGACEDRGWLQGLPKMGRLYLKEPPGRTRWFEDHEIPKFLQALGTYPNYKLAAAAQAVFLIALTTGARRSEILGVHPIRDISHGPHGLRMVLRKTKTNQPRVVPITEEAAELIERFHPWGPEETGYRHFGTRIYDVWNHAKKRLGLEGDDELVLHSSRHTFATQLVDDEVNLRVIQHLLGHSSITTTQRYTHASEKASTAALKGLQGRMTNLMEKYDA